MADKSGNSNIGTLTAGITKATGKIGQAIKFDGVANRYVNAPTSPSLDGILTNHKFTFSGWAKVASGGNDFIGFYYNGTYWGYMIRMESNNALTLTFQDSGGNWRSIATTLTVPLNTWSFIAVTFDSVTQKVIMYLNGNSQSFDNTYVSAGTGSPFRIGANGWYYVDGA